MTLSSTELQAIIDRARTGRRSAITELYEVYGTGVRCYCYARLNDMAAAEDCTQDVFFRIWRRIQTFEYRGEGSFTAWMYAVANNVLNDYARKHKAMEHVPLTPQLHLTDTRHTDTARTICDRLALHEAIGQLTPAQQQVITLKFFAGMTNPEIAEALGCSEGAVKGLQHRAITKLHHALNREEALPVPGPAAGEAGL